MKTESALSGNNAEAQSTLSWGAVFGLRREAKRHAAFEWRNSTRKAMSPLPTSLRYDATRRSATAVQTFAVLQCSLPTSPHPARIFQERGRSRARSAYDCQVRSGLSDAFSAVHPLRPRDRSRSFACGYAALRLGVFAFILLPLCLRAATNDLSGLLQKGLFEEEANRNLEAAAQAYQTVSVQFDKDRKLAATAIFRLGEIYRKQGKTNEAAGQYERIVREFADQDTLVTLSRQNITGLGITAQSSVPTIRNGATLDNLQSQYALLNAQLVQARMTTNNAIIAELFSDAKDLVEQMHLAASMIVPGQSMLRDAQARGVEAGIQEAERNLRQTEQRVAALRQQILDYETLRLKIFESAIQQAGDGQETQTTTSRANETATDDEEKEIRRIQAMIQNSPDLINAASGDPRVTPLIVAATKGQTRVARFLLDHGADVNLAANALTPLGAAVANGHKAMTELLLSRGANVNGECYRDQTALHVAADKGFRAVAEVLLANKAQLEARTGKGTTPLHLAAQHGAASLVQLLVSSGANVNAEDNDGVTALSYALASRKPEVVGPLLAAKADPNAGKANLPLLVALRELRDGDTETLEELLRSGADANKEGRVRWDVSSGGNNYLGGTTVTPLWLAVSGNKPEAVKLLLKHKADPNGKNPSGIPVLLNAVGNTNILSALLEAGAAPDANDGNGIYALSQVVWIRNSAAVEMLLAHGANANVRTADGRAPLDYAVEREDKKSVELLLAAKAEVNAKTFHGSSALHAAVNQDSKDVVELLLANGADVNLKNKEGETPLHWAVRIGNQGTGSQEMVALLLAKGADPNIRNDQSLTPLDLTKSENGVPGGIGFGAPGLPTMAVPAGAPGVPSRVLRQPAGSVAPAKPDPASVAAFLRQHGALDDLPKLDRIEVRRPSANFSAIAFQMGTNGWNEFGLLELIALHYGLISTERNAVWGVNNWEIRNFWRGPLCQFPDLGHMVIRRPSATGPQRTEMAVNVAELLDSGDCARDVKLKPGDIIEIPEADHPVNESWAGLEGQQLSNLLHCVSRTVTISIKGTPTTIRLAPEFKPTNMYGSDAKPMQALTRGSFMLKSVLAQSRLLRASSDLSRVKVTRANAPGGKKQEWLLDCSGGNNPDLWLRDGDVIEVPDKQ